MDGAKPAGFVEPGRIFYVQIAEDYLFSSDFDPRGQFLEDRLIAGHENGMMLGNRGPFDIHGDGFACAVKHVTDYDGAGKVPTSRYALVLTGDEILKPIRLTAQVSHGA